MKQCVQVERTQVASTLETSRHTKIARGAVGGAMLTSNERKHAKISPNTLINTYFLYI